MKYETVPDKWTITYIIGGDVVAKQFDFDSYTFSELIDYFARNVRHDRIISVVGV